MKLLKKLPDTLTIILCISIVFIIMTWLIPSGEFDREVVNDREVVIAGTYKPVDSQPQGVGAFLTAPIKGFSSASMIIAFVFLVNRHTDLTYRRDKLQKLIGANQLELDVFDGKIEELTPGKEYIDTTHLYSHDIDLFGHQLALSDQHYC